MNNYANKNILLTVVLKTIKFHDYKKNKINLKIKVKIHDHIYDIISLYQSKLTISIISCTRTLLIISH